MVCVRVQNTQLGQFTCWDLEKFESRLEQMRELYQVREEGGREGRRGGSGGEERRRGGREGEGKKSVERRRGGEKGREK